MADGVNVAVTVDEDSVLAVVGNVRRRRIRRVVVWGGVVLTLVVGLALARARLDRPPPAPSYQTEVVDRGDIDETVGATGTLEAKRVVSVGGEISGRIATVEVDVNDRVKAGDVLATLDPVSLDNALTEAKGALATAKIEVVRAKAALDAASITKERAEALSAKGVVAQEELDAAISEHRLAEAEASRAKSERSLAAVRVEQARTNKAKATIVAPIDGVVLTRSVEPGNAIAASLAAPELFQIAEDLSVMRLDLGVDEADVGRVREGQSAEFTVDAWPGRTFDATVERVNLAPATTDTSAVVTYTTVLAVNNDEELLRPGMTATATILAERHAEVLRIPTLALRFDPSRGAESSGGRGDRNKGGLFSVPTRPGPPARKAETEIEPTVDGEALVHVLRAGELVAVPVTVGASDGRYTEVEAGELDEGDAVVVGMRGGA
ncbi:Macrolide export protein MacA [Enhygromyxa salina]|uniref:Macrolide export protein MacA n=1 Tax=Enhygromyxa salina TaxID=215803 RepID=A0A2S9XE84_9BACT|nr:efflux RND transporter periplasmic adaptor subunit [Enhygromyxa salina]PRP91176.1 Macrolide export protein MacA [Enhygromyxa salina]